MPHKLCLPLKRATQWLVVSCILLNLHCAKGILKVDEDTFKAPEDFKEVGIQPSTPPSEPMPLTPDVAAPAAPLPTKEPPKTVAKETLVKSGKRFAKIPDHTFEIPFKEGERTQYLLSYFALRGGLITLEVRPSKNYQGLDSYYFHGSVISSSLVNLFYRVDDWMDVVVEKKKFLPLRGSFSLNETAQVKQRIVIQDHDKGQAKFWSKLVAKDNKVEEINRVDAMTPGSQEMLSAFFYARLLRPKLGQKYTVPVYENGKNMVAILEGVGEELVNTRLGNFSSTKIKITTQVEGVLKQTGDIFMWLSNDADALMVKFAADIKIGVIRGVLIRRQTINERLDLGM